MLLCVLSMLTVGLLAHKTTQLVTGAFLDFSSKGKAVPEASDEPSQRRKVHTLCANPALAICFPSLFVLFHSLSFFSPDVKTLLSRDSAGILHAWGEPFLWMPFVGFTLLLSQQLPGCGFHACSPCPHASPHLWCREAPPQELPPPSHVLAVGSMAPQL